MPIYHSSIQLHIQSLSGRGYRMCFVLMRYGYATTSDGETRVGNMKDQ